MNPRMRNEFSHMVVDLVCGAGGADTGAFADPSLVLSWSFKVDNAAMCSNSPKQHLGKAVGMSCVTNPGLCCFHHKCKLHCQLALC